jgi:hypothetical protein
MTASNWIEIILALMAVISGVVGYLAYREAHSDRNAEKSRNQMEHVLHPLETRVYALELTFNRIADTIAAAITAAQSPVLQTIASVETKLGFMWEQQKQLTMDVAKILHQPDPRREFLDKLLEALMDGTISEEEERELRKYLIIMRNWEPGQDVGFPVHPGEQGMAAILLRGMHYLKDNPFLSSAQHGED